MRANCICFLLFSLDELSSALPAPIRMTGENVCIRQTFRKLAGIANGVKVMRGSVTGNISALSEATRSLIRRIGSVGAVAFDKAVRRKPLAGCGGRGSMEIQSIFAWKSLPDTGFGKNVVIDAHRCSRFLVHLK